MDLIKQLISAKEGYTDLPLEQILTELIKYEKLSKSDKFKSIMDTPLLQKQMPKCWAAFNGDAQAFWLVQEASRIMQGMAVRPLQIFNDINHVYNPRQQRQMEVIGNINQHRFNYLRIERLPDNYAFDNCFFLVEEAEDNDSTTISVIETNEKTTTIYNGVVTHTTLEEFESGNVVIEPFTYVQGDDKITINTYSNQGNNDYNFAHSNQFQISMHEDNFVYEQKPKVISGRLIQGYQSIVKIAAADMALINMNGENLNVIADLIFKYMAEVAEDDQRVFQDMLSRKTIEVAKEDDNS